MFVIRSRKMQLKAQCLRGLFSLTLVLLLRSWFVTNINAYPVQLINPWIIRPLQMLPRMMKTRKSTHSPFISYRLDSWSQYNNPEEGAQREGDIRRKSRKTITTDKTLLWPNGIVKYYVHSSIVNEPLKFIMLETALQMIMSKTCIKFVRIDDYAELLANGSWVNITGHDEGCYSDIGCNAYGPSILNLNVEECFHTVGHAIHETLHTLGVYHEHMRPDRDKYISIIWENMKKGDEFNFELLNNSVVTDYGLPYDYDSIMHYSMTAFSTDRSLPTIIPKNFYVEIGQRNHLSYYDIQKLQIAYNCDTVSINKLKKEPLNKPKKLKKLPKSKKLQDTTVVGRKINQECPPLL
ncbi:PREDICTED: zinc metalloproteinase nas-4 isoform X1 [Trachymyrmex cornetzi]|uniref:zinc metalloproteinase nas-4 isoform X1 n=1 Tax=Trachymyrmex cornetzi TaxID=471704 RepID=UPI00084F542A|nr:PREDICTED: zinc metalloproteinase nas-4 isoform X1 [Trachymyrmex cornetzi]